jgi:hypothetical protein
MTEQGTPERYPQNDQIITVVAVSNGAVSVGGASVILSKEKRVVIRLTDDDCGTPIKGQPFTLLYDRGEERILRLKTRVSDVIDGRKCLLEPTAPVSEGERREFLRAQVMGRVYLEQIDEDFELFDEAEEVDSSRWLLQELDLSGSGVKLEWEEPCKKGDSILVCLVLGDDASPISAIGRVVRARPNKKSGKFDVAVQFSRLSESDRDRLINVVFKHIYQQVGNRFGTTLTLDGS